MGGGKASAGNAHAEKVRYLKHVGGAYAYRRDVLQIHSQQSAHTAVARGINIARYLQYARRKCAPDIATTENVKPDFSSGIW